MDILIVEDEFLLALVLEDCLTRAGHRVIGPARRRAEAMAHAVRSRPDLALLDIRLADGDSGIDVAADLEEEVGVPVLYASGQIDEAQRSGVGVGILSKPFSESALLQAVEVVEQLRRGGRPSSLPEGLTLFPEAQAEPGPSLGGEEGAGVRLGNGNQRAAPTPHHE